jgi:CBS domain-containing protein
MVVRDIMTKDVVTVAPSEALKTAAAKMLEHGISGVPVVDASGLAGVLSETDILFKERVHPERRRLLDRLLRDPNAPPAVKLDARLVEEAMTAPAVTIAPGRPVSDAATTLLELGIDRLPVVDGGRLVGIVTRSDLVRAFIRSDESIADEIRDDVVVRKAWASPGSITISVTRGEVVLEGDVDSETVAETVVSLARRVPGVVDVESRLSWPARVPA